MRTIFNQLLFKTVSTTEKCNKEADFGFFVPGVNSGIYSPATLVVQVKIEEYRAGFFKLNKFKTFGSITLTPDQFDELFSEMEKIKKLRDSNP